MSTGDKDPRVADYFKTSECKHIPQIPHPLIGALKGERIFKGPFDPMLTKR